jgi:sigma-B regulation protein RsbU (phosphoserine phosphatase)
MNSPGPPAVEQLFEHAPCAHLVADMGGRLVLVNATLCDWLGYDKTELLAGPTFADLLSMGGRIFHQTHIAPLLRMQGSVAEVKLDFRRKDGKLLPVIVNATERPWNGVPFLHVAAFVVEDRHRYEQELLRQRQRAEELAAENARGQRELAAERGRAEERAAFAEKLVGVVSHDIRNPLSVIRMSTVLLERSGLSDSQRVTVDRVARAVTRVNHLLGDLLDFTQAKLGRGLELVPATVDLHQSLSDSIADQQVAFLDRVIRFERHGSGFCVADVNRVLQAVGNLVANAVAHGAPDRPVTVTTASKADTFTISVHNFGAVIPADQIPNLFQPMVRGPEAHAEEGIGLGLFIVREIVERHQGTIHVDSSTERGTTFTIVLPCTPPGSSS